MAERKKKVKKVKKKHEDGAMIYRISLDWFSKPRELDKNMHVYMPSIKKQSTSPNEHMDILYIDTTDLCMYVCTYRETWTFFQM